MKPIQVGLLGLGVVGTGVFQVLQRNQEEIQRRAGRGIEIVAVSRRDVAAARRVVGQNVSVHADAFEVVRNPAVEIVVELIGGTDAARDLVLKAIENDKHVVTANKALIAHHGAEIFAAAAKKQVAVAYEAAVALSEGQALDFCGLCTEHLFEKEAFFERVSSRGGFLEADQSGGGLGFGEVLDALPWRRLV